MRARNAVVKVEGSARTLVVSWQTGNRKTYLLHNTCIRLPLQLLRGFHRGALPKEGIPTIYREARTAGLPLRPVQSSRQWWGVGMPHRN